MVVKYDVFGRKIGSHYLALATLGATFLGAYLSMGGSPKEKAQGPPINATSKDEENFIKSGRSQGEALSGPSMNRASLLSRIDKMGES
ncbi:hypothetical protein LTR28_006268 [Elasticomyces elasticus]|nr:hypothetical protein LTR28_006268 [Elasticomyces elasticus]